MIVLGPSSSLGSGMGRPERHARLAFDAALAAWDASARLFGWVKRRCRPTAAGLPSGAEIGTATPGPRKGLPAERQYAASTVRRYRQIAARFVAWRESLGPRRGAEPDLAAFLAAVVGDTDSTATRPAYGRRDPRHRGLLRTTIYAVRAIVDRPLGRELTAAVCLPPRPEPVPAADPDTVTALRGAVRDARERLLVMLSCDLGLRPGQMVGLRWRDVCLRQDRVHLGARTGRLAVAMPASCQTAMAACARGHEPAAFLFPSPQHAGRKAATVRTLQNALRRLAQRAGVNSAPTFVSLRKACLASQCARSGPAPGEPAPSAAGSPGPATG